MILCLGSFWPPSIGNLSRSCICKGNRTNILGGKHGLATQEPGDLLVCVWFKRGLAKQSNCRNYSASLQGSLYIKRYNTVHSKEGRASFWQHRRAGTGPRQTSEPGLAAALKLGSYSSIQNTCLVSNPQPAHIGGDTVFTCPYDRPPAWLKMLFKQPD